MPNDTLDADFTKIVQSDKEAAQANPDMIQPAQFETMFKILGIDPTSISLYVIAWLCEAKAPLCITRDEFVKGMRKKRMYGADQIKKNLGGLCGETQLDEHSFKKFYFFCWEWVRNSGEQRFVDATTAFELWPILFALHEFKLLKEFIEYLKGRKTERIEKMLWKSLVELQKCDPAKWSEDNSTFPCLVDDFLKAVKK